MNAVRPVTAGGTGASTVADARTTLGLAIGVDVAAYADRVPSGLIAMWSGAISAIPEGWNLCDGTNSTPDLTNMFIVGAGDDYAIGDTGGEDTHTLTADELPAHTHAAGTLATAAAGSHKHNIGLVDSSDNVLYGGTAASHQRREGNDSGNVNPFTSTEPNHTHDITGSTASIGSGDAHENRPPYYALAFIMKA